MKKISDGKLIHFIVYRSKTIEKIFLITVLICILCYPFVGINYDLSQYLPGFAPTKQALDVMEEEFGYPGMARVMVKDTTIYEAKKIREKIADVDGVSLVVGADSISDVYMADSFVQNNLTDKFFKDGNAVMEIVFEKGDSDKETHEALKKIYKLVGDRGAFSGSAVSNKERQESVTKEITVAIVIALISIVAILTLTTTSWFEPFLFVSVMIVAVLINMGSNIMFGSISFFTFSTAAILQMAVSMDYSIFLLHTFTSYKNQGMDIKEAMEAALHDSSRSILASAATTIVGFIVIATMRFTIGKDVGFVLTKGIIASLVTVLFLMPALILRFDERISKTVHKPFIPPFTKFSHLMYKIRGPILIISLLLAIPCYVGQSMNKFYYGDDALGAGPGTKVYNDAKSIDEVFGKSNVILAIVPNENIVKERELTDALGDLDFVNYSLSISGVIPKGIPEDFLPKKILKEFRSENYTRILVSMKTEQESDYAFECSKKLEETVKSYYSENSHVIGMTPTTMDIRDILTEDYDIVSILSLIGVAVVVMITFKSIFVPILVIIPIEVAIYLNMTLPYVMGDSMVYIGYIIVSCLQLGATVDYSILMTTNYLDERKTKDRKEAAFSAISKSALSILTSGAILSVVGYLLYFTSSIQAISQVGHLVGRGALLSIVLVLSLLPALLSFFDKTIRKQQARSQARREKRKAIIRKGFSSISVKKQEEA